MGKFGLISIRMPHTERIFHTEDRKTIEWRTQPLPNGWNYVYETKGQYIKSINGACTKYGYGSGKVIGQIEISGHRKFYSALDIPPELIAHGKVDREFLLEYAHGRPLYANFIIATTKYAKPLDITSFYTDNLDDKDYSGIYLRNYLTRPPQSFQYVSGYSLV